MKTGYIGMTRVLYFDGHAYPDNFGNAQAISNAEWARSILDKPDDTFPNGIQSHEVAGRVLDESLDALCGYELYSVGGVK